MSHDNEEFTSPREEASAPSEIEVTPIEELEAQAEAGTLAEPEPSVGSALLDAAAPGVEEAVETVAEAAANLSDADPTEPVEGAIPLSQIQPDLIAETALVDVASGERVVTDRINYKMVGHYATESEAAETVASLPEGSFYKKNPNDPRPGFRVYKRV